MPSEPFFHFQDGLSCIDASGNQAYLNITRVVVDHEEVVMSFVLKTSANFFFFYPFFKPLKTTLKFMFTPALNIQNTSKIGKFSCQ